MTGLPGRVAATVGPAILVALIAWLAGVGLAQSTLLASVAVTVGAGPRLLPLATDVSLPGRLVVRRPGTRRDVAGLSGALTGRKGRVTRPTAQRIRSLAEHRLARVGIDLHDPRHAAAAVALLGRDAYAALIAHPASPMRYPTLVHCVAALERLDHSRLDHSGPAAPMSAPGSPT